MRGQALGTLSFVKDSDTSSASHIGQFSWTYSVPTSSVASFTHDDTRTETFDVTIGDGNGNSAVQTITVTLHGPDQAPVGVNDTAAAQSTHPVATGNLLANDHDPDADTLTVTGVVNGEATSTTITVHGTYGDLVVTKATGYYTYTLGATPGEQAALGALGGGHSAPDTFAYTVDDGHGGSAQANLTVTATGHNILHVGNGGYATIYAAMSAAAAVTRS
jgi:VCBS repeat-containing protein